MVEDQGSQLTDAAALLDDTETALEAAVWMMQDMGVHPPPLPNVYVDTISEFSVNSIYGTDESLAGLQSREALTQALEPGKSWPQSGLAFGFLNLGFGGIWFYTLVGEQMIIQISLRISFYEREATQRGIASVNAAHRMLEAYLKDDVHYSRITRPYPPADGVSRRVVSYAAEFGFPSEATANWSESEGLTAFAPKPDIFVISRPAVPEAQDFVVFRS